MLAPYNGLTINAARRLLTRDFNSAGCEAPDVDAKLLVGFAAAMDASELIAQGDSVLTPEQSGAISAYAARRISGEPVSQIIGQRAFWNDAFIVTRDVLTPRPETEGIIEASLTLFDKVAALDILDIGTGSGAIILSLLGEFPKARGTGADISEAALAVAKNNRVHLGRDCCFIHSDWFANLEGQYDLIVSNPPYITRAEMMDLPRDVSGFEPALALCGGEDGLTPYRVIATGLRQYLKAGGWVIFEIGHLQGKDVSQILYDHGLENIKLIKDLAGCDRIVLAQK